jgi:hypothetical protein
MPLLFVCARQVGHVIKLLCHKEPPFFLHVCGFGFFCFVHHSRSTSGGRISSGIQRTKTLASMPSLCGTLGIGP